MPEGPEIKRAADALHVALRRRKAQRVFFAFARLRRFSARLEGARIGKVVSRSKAILTHFGNGYVIYTHNQLYGRWEICAAGEYPDTGRSLRLAIHTRDTMALLYSASEIEVLRTAELEHHPYLASLGPELLDEETPVETVVARFEDSRFQRRNLMNLLQDQRFIAGMGNYLCCEVLFACGIHPDMRLADLTRKRRERLARTSHHLTWQSYRTGGITNRLSLARRLRNEGLPFEAYRFAVYRREGLPCYRCGAPIVKGRFGGRSGYMCPVCQPFARGG